MHSTVFVSGSLICNVLPLIAAEGINKPVKSLV